MPPSPPQDRKSTPRAEPLRRDIDRGKTSDKVAADDPDAAPLDTDDEAAGTAPTPSRIDRAILQGAAPRSRRGMDTDCSRAGDSGDHYTGMEIRTLIANV
jgi:hypothetical protein